MSQAEIIDVWAKATFDQELARYLDDHAALISKYVNRDKQIFLDFDHRPSPSGTLLRPENEHAGAYFEMLEELVPIMASRTLRAWHYTRMTDDEVSALRRDGVHLSTPETLAHRIEALTSSGLIEASLGAALIAASPFQGDQRASRGGKFWLVSHPTSVADSGVTRLLRYWGGEVASFWTDEPKLLDPIEKIGRPRVLEVAVPLTATKHATGAAQAVIATQARALRCVEHSKAFDLYVTTPLPPSALITVTSEDDPRFARIGCDYPNGYVDTDATYWKDLTGEDD